MVDLGDELLDGMADAFPRWDPTTRPSHSSGLAATGTFRGTPQAGEFCDSPIFATTPTSVVVRFSNSKGQIEPDWEPDVRGLAIKFLSDAYVADVAGDRQIGQPQLGDLICISTPMFVVDTPEDLLSFEEASVPRPVKRRSWWHRTKSLLSLIEYPPQDFSHPAADDAVMAWSQHKPKSHPFLSMLAGFAWTWNQDVQRLVRSKPPASYARLTYHAIHSFTIDGRIPIEGRSRVRRTVRFMFEPAAGVREEHSATIPDDYLQTELAARLQRGNCRFNLRMQISDPWDDTSDPTKVWPLNRQRILMGTLELTALVESEPRSGGERLSFNPAHVPPGITPVADPIFEARVAVYERSQERRGAEKCPFAPAGTDIS